MPSGFHASDPSASLFAGMPNSMKPSTPFEAVSTASLRRASSVSWDWPGMLATGTGSVMPSFTNSGAIRSCGARSVSRIRLRRAGVRRIVGAGAPESSWRDCRPGRSGRAGRVNVFRPAVAQ